MVRVVVDGSVVGGGVGDVVLDPGTVVLVLVVLLVLLVLVVGGTAYLLWKKGLYSTSVCGAEKFLTG